MEATCVLNQFRVVAPRFYALADPWLEGAWLEPFFSDAAPYLSELLGSGVPSNQFLRIATTFVLASVGLLVQYRAQSAIKRARLVKRSPRA
jgi:hypothetical protein